MSGKQRKRQLARQRYERRVARQAAARARARRRGAIIGTVLAVALVAGGVSLLVLNLRGGDGTKQAAASTSASPSPSGTCAYTRTPKDEKGVRSKFVGLPSKKADPSTPYVATFKTNRGDIVVDLLAKQAPCTVNSLRFLAGKDFYDDTTCHRLVTTGIHVLQCGDPFGEGNGGPGYSFPDENLTGATYPRGTVAMANSGPDTNGSQFFFVYDKGGLDPKYTPFGKVVKGLDIVDEIAKAGVAKDGVAPQRKVVIEDVTVSKKT